MAETFGTFLRRGLAAGVVGGVASAACLWWLGEPAIRDALAVETELSSGDGHEELFSRGVQVVGGLTASLLAGLVLGLLFTVVFVKVRNRGALPSDAHVAIAAGAVLFLVLALVPWLKYPPNPPGVGDPDTIDQRTIAYVALIVLAVCAVLLANDVGVRLARREAPRGWRWVAVVATFVAVVAVGYAMLPAAESVPQGMSADLLWRFRVASIAGQGALWGAIALTMSVLCGNGAPSARRGAPAPAQADPVGR